MAGTWMTHGDVHIKWICRAGMADTGIIAHNMRRPQPNPRYLEAITTSPDLDTSFVLMDGAGVGITLKKR